MFITCLLLFKKKKVKIICKKIFLIQFLNTSFTMGPSEAVPATACILLIRQLDTHATILALTI